MSKAQKGNKMATREEMQKEQEEKAKKEQAQARRESEQARKESEQKMEKPGTRTGIYEEDEAGKLVERVEQHKYQQYAKGDCLMSEEEKEEKRKEQEELKRRKEESDKKLEQYQKEQNDPEKSRARRIQAEDDFKVASEKLSKARDYFLEAEKRAEDTDDPNIYELRELRSQAYLELRDALQELKRRIGTDFPEGI